MESRIVAFFLLASTFALASHAAIHSYSGDFTPQTNSHYFIGGSEGLLSSSFIRFEDVTFVRSLESARKQNATGLVEAIVFELDDRDNFGGTLLRSDAVCCTPEFSASGVCRLGEVIIKRDGGSLDWPKRLKTFFHGNETEAKMPREEVAVNKTGIYFLYFFVCDPELAGISISGRTAWRNPSGFLPGKFAPLLPFFGAISLAYLALGVVRTLWLLLTRQRMTQLQHHLSLLIALCMFETAIQYYEYAEFNLSGRRPMEVTVWAVTFSSVRKTLSRLLLLLGSLGYGVLKPAQEGITARLLLLVCGYFVATESRHLAEGLGVIDDSFGEVMIALVIPVALLDLWIIIRTFSSLARTVAILRVNNHAAKARLYLHFTVVFTISSLLSLFWIGFEMFFFGGDLTGLWMGWIVPVFWHSHAFALLTASCFIWAPSLPRRDYQRVEETREDDIVATESKLEMQDMTSN